MAGKTQELMQRYGWLGITIYFAIFFLVFAGFVIAIQAGYKAESTGEEAGVWLAAYLATKATQILRIAATLALTPIVERIIGRRSEPPEPDVESP